MQVEVEISFSHVRVTNGVHVTKCFAVGLKMRQSVIVHYPKQSANSTIQESSTHSTCLVSHSQPLFLPPFLYADIIGGGNGGETVTGYGRLALAVCTFVSKRKWPSGHTNTPHCSNLCGLGL